VQQQLHFWSVVNWYCTNAFTTAMGVTVMVKKHTCSCNLSLPVYNDSFLSVAFSPVAISTS